MKTFQGQWDDMKKSHEDALSLMKGAERRAVEAEKALDLERKKMGEDMAQVLKKISVSKPASPRQEGRSIGGMEVDDEVPRRPSLSHELRDVGTHFGRSPLLAPTNSDQSQVAENSAQSRSHRAYTPVIMEEDCDDQNIWVNFSLHSFKDFDK